MDFENSSSKILNVGLISFGLSGRVFHGPFLATNPNSNLVAVYERTKSESLEFAAIHGLNITLVRSEAELVNFNGLDLVVVCSPIEFHFEHGMLALAAGKHVLVEKAFCSTSEQARELLSFAKEKGLVCMPYQNRRYDSDFLTIQKILPSLGKIAEYNGYYNRFSPIVRPGNWKDSVVGSGGNFLSLGSHMIDQAVALFGIPDRVWGDVRAQRAGAVLDDAFEVHLFYDTARNNITNKNTALTSDAVSATTTSDVSTAYTSAGNGNGNDNTFTEMDGSNSCDEGSVDEYGLRHGGFRAILKGSLLCRDHAIRYMIHGSDGSFVKSGVDTQEALLMKGVLPPAHTKRSVGAAYPEQQATSQVDNTTNIDSTTDCNAIVYGGEPKCQWGTLTLANSKELLVPPVLGSYNYLYDALYDSIVHHIPPAVDSHTAVAVLRIIELARESSLEGRVLPYTDHNNGEKSNESHVESERWV